MEMPKELQNKHATRVYLIEVSDAATCFYCDLIV